MSMDKIDALYNRLGELTSERTPLKTLATTVHRPMIIERLMQTDVKLLKLLLDTKDLKGEIESALAEVKRLEGEILLESRRS